MGSPYNPGPGFGVTQGFKPPKTNTQTGKSVGGHSGIDYKAAEATPIPAAPPPKDPHTV